MTYFEGTPTSVAVFTAGGGQTVFALPPLTFPNASFVGFTSSTPITSVFFANGGNGVGGVDIDNLAVGSAVPGHFISGQIAGLPSNITLSDPVLLADQTGTGGTTYGAYPLILAESGVGSIPPPPVLVDPALLGSSFTHPDVSFLAQYADSNTGGTGLAVLVAENGGTGAPPPVIVGPYGSNFNGPTESEILAALVAQSGAGTAPPPVGQDLTAFMQQNGGYLASASDGGSFGGDLYSFSDAQLIGTVTLTETVIAPEPGSLVLGVLALLGVLAVLAVRRFRR